MISVVVLLRRPPTWTREQFHRWWLDEHVRDATKLPLITEEHAVIV